MPVVYVTIDALLKSSLSLDRFCIDRILVVYTYAVASYMVYFGIMFSLLLIKNFQFSTVVF